MLTGPSTVRLEVAFPADVLYRYYPNGRLGGLTIDGHPPGPLGQTVQLVVAIERPRREFKLEGLLAWARHKGSAQLKESFGVDLLGNTEAVARLLAFSRSALEPQSTRADPRMAVNLPVKMINRGQRRKETLIDLSLGGAFVKTSWPLEVGEQLELQIRSPGALLHTSFAAQVRWNRLSGDEMGMGLEFLDPDKRDRISRLIQKLNDLR